MTQTPEKTKLQLLPVWQLQRGRYQPRREFDADALDELAESIRSSGIVQPIVVRPHPSHKDTYEIIAGERRWRAAQCVGLDKVPCIVNDYTDEQAAAVTTIENIQRKDLNPIEEANALQRLIDEFGYLHEEVAAIIGKSRAKVTNALRLLRLASTVQNLLISGQLSEGHGKILASLSTQQQLEFAHKAVKQGWSVRSMEQALKKYQVMADQPTSSDADQHYLERKISDYLGSKVEMDMETDTKGWLKIKFYDQDTLQGLLEKMGLPDEE